MPISAKPLPMRTVSRTAGGPAALIGRLASRGRLMVLDVQPRSGLNGRRIGDQVSAPCARVSQVGVVASRRELWCISSTSNRSKKGLPRSACGAISGHRWDGGADEGEAGGLVKLRPLSKVGDPYT